MIFKPLPKTIRNVLITAATAYGEHVLTGKFWSSGLGRKITHWSDKLTRINGRLDRLTEKILEIENRLENFESELGAAARRKLEEKLGKLRAARKKQRTARGGQLDVMRTLQGIRRGIRPGGGPRMPGAGGWPAPIEWSTV